MDITKHRKYIVNHVRIKRPVIIFNAFRQQVAELVGKSKEAAWDIMHRFAAQLDQLQHKSETLTSEAPADPVTVCNDYWRRVANNIMDLVNKLPSRHQVSMYLMCSCSYTEHTLHI